jgi:putative hemolysin
VVEDNLDNVLGIVHTKDLLLQNLADQPLDLKALVRPPLFVPENVSALKVLELFKQAGAHMALVIDEYGSILGMVTHNDILEEIVGYVPSASEPSKPGATPRRDGSWLLDGLLPIDDLKEIFEIERLPEEEYAGYQTVGGFMMTQLGNIPTVGQYFEWGNLRFEVVDMDGRRIDKVLVTPVLAALPVSDPVASPPTTI